MTGGFIWEKAITKAKLFDTLEEALTAGRHFYPYHMQFAYIDPKTKEVIQLGDSVEIQSTESSEGLDTEPIEAQ